MCIVLGCREAGSNMCPEHRRQWEKSPEWDRAHQGAFHSEVPAGRFKSHFTDFVNRVQREAAALTPEERARYVQPEFVKDTTVPEAEVPARKLIHRYMEGGAGLLGIPSCGGIPTTERGEVTCKACLSLPA